MSPPKSRPSGAPKASATIRSLDDRLLSLVERGRVLGVDEAGRGPLAGSVFAAAVVLPPSHTDPRLRDSKKLSEAAREALAPEIRRDAAAWAVAGSSPARILEHNILGATLLAMSEAIAGIDPDLYDVILVDGNRLPDSLPAGKEAYALVKGDGLCPTISAASILAKTSKDAEMRELDAVHPGYGFKRNKGYGTREHLDAIRRLGYLECHRLGFSPIKEMVERGLPFGRPDV